MSMVLDLGLACVERGWMPRVLTRAAMRQLCRRRLREERSRSTGPEAFVEDMRRGPVAPLPDKANEQHYEVPAEFFRLVLGPHRKYSSCYWPQGMTELSDAERFTLSLTCRRAEVRNGQDILELGCGWGSLSLWMARRYPDSRITAVSNSTSQRQFIEAEAASLGLGNLSVITSDMNDFETTNCFDRVVSVEMFEHMRNYAELLRRIAGWLRPQGKLFVHIFCHRDLAYAFETTGSENWMGRHFFTGGIMPSRDLLKRFDEHLTVSRQWDWDGTHYQRTAEAWLVNLDARAADALPVLADTYGTARAGLWLERWRLFFMAVAELFGCDGGRQWGVSHYLLEPTTRDAPRPDTAALTTVA